MARIGIGTRSEAARLRRLRELIQFTQGEFAAEFGVATSAISQWESGAHAMPGPALKLLAIYESELGVTSDDAEAPTKPRLGANIAAAAFLAVFLGMPDGDAEDSFRSRLRAKALHKYVALAGQLKGFSMKVAQMAAYMDLSMPEAYREALLSLASKASPMSALQVRRVFVTDFGVPPTELFEEWSPEPFATGSVGQVHAAVSHGGERVAVKVQYFGMRQALETDMRHLAPSDRLLRVMARRQEAGTLIGELTARFIQELDYRLEAKRQKEFDELFSHCPEICIPKVFDELSSDQVLTSSFSEGATLDEFVKTASQDEKNRLGRALWEYFHLAIFKYERFPTDPHPGNFLFSREHVTCLDFGRVQDLSPDFVEKWRRVMRASVERNRTAVRAALCAIDYVPDPADFDFEHAHRAALVFYLPWLKDEPFAFTAELLPHLWRVIGPENTNLTRLSYPGEMAFMTQLYFGLSALLARLGACIRCRDIVLDLLYAQGEPRPAPFTDEEIAGLL